MASSVVIWLFVGGGIRRAKKADMREASNYTPVATLYVNSVCCSQSLLSVTCGAEIPYSSKFSWHNIFVNFVINLEITKILFTKFKN